MSAVDDDLRRAAFAMAYRMLGSVSEAEDVVQETLLRVHRARERGEEIASPRAYAGTVAARLAIDELRSARARRETYVGEWLPEPLVGAAPDDPAGQAQMADSLSVAFLVLLESLTPEQRAAFLLRDVFDYGYGEIAEIIGSSEDNARQLASRARRQVAERRPRFAASPDARDELARRFFAAAQEGLLADDVVLRGDGGGKVPALARSLHGRRRVARTLVNWSRLGARMAGVAIRPAEVNGQPGALFVTADGGVFAVMALEIEGDRVRSVSSVVNPDKLAHVGRVGDMREIFRSPPSVR
jgi:RNA polymerase sigma factor (sigma-70 family)